MKILTLALTALLLTACNTESELQPPETPEEKPAEITYEIRMHSPIEFFGGTQANDWYIASNIPSPLTDTLAQWDAALFQIKNDQETLLAESIIEITPELKENHALLPYNRHSSDSNLILYSILPETDNTLTTLFTYNPTAKEFQPFSEEMNAMYSMIAPEGTKTMFVAGPEDDAHSLTFFDLKTAKLIKKITLPKNEKILTPINPDSYSGELEPDAFGQIYDFGWLDTNTFQYHTFDTTGAKSTTKTIEL